jgi:hypothetical protein
VGTINIGWKGWIKWKQAVGAGVSTVALHAASSGWQKVYNDYSIHFYQQNAHKKLLFYSFINVDVYPCTCFSPWTIFYTMITCYWSHGSKGDEQRQALVHVHTCDSASQWCWEQLVKVYLVEKIHEIIQKASLCHYSESQIKYRERWKVQL